METETPFRIVHTSNMSRMGKIDTDYLNNKNKSPVQCNKFAEVIRIVIKFNRKYLETGAKAIPLTHTYMTAHLPHLKSMNSDTIVHGLIEKRVVIKSLISVTRNLTEPKV